MSHQQPGLKLIAPAPVVFGIPFVAGIVLHFVFGSVRLGMPVPVALTLGALFLGASVALAGWSLAVMIRSGENPDPRHPTSALIDTGPFAHSRNPIYVSFVLGGIGIALGINSVFMLASIPIGAYAIGRLIIVREEEYLSKLFGDAFGRYASRVRRWI